MKNLAIQLQRDIRILPIQREARENAEFTIFRIIKWALARLMNAHHPGGKLDAVLVGERLIDIKGSCMPPPLLEL